MTKTGDKIVPGDVVYWTNGLRKLWIVVFVSREKSCIDLNYVPVTLVNESGIVEWGFNFREEVNVL